MTNREIGCKTTGCGCGLLVVFMFFWGLLSFADRQLAETKKMVQKRVAEDALGDLPLLYDAIHRYAEANQGKLPPMENADALRGALGERYLPMDKAYVNMRDGKAYQPNPELSGKKLFSLKSPAATVLLSEATADKAGKRRALYADGSVRETSPSQPETANR